MLISSNPRIIHITSMLGKLSSNPRIIDIMGMPGMHHTSNPKTRKKLIFLLLNVCYPYKLSFI